MNVDPDLQAILEFLGRNEHVVVLAFLACAGVMWAALSSVVAIFRTVQRERTRREIAAYIAEGSMTPEQGERLLAAGNKKEGCC